MPSPSDAEPSHPFLERLVRLAGARREQTVCVCGRHASELSIDLCHKRFAHVECVRGVTCRAADEPAEVLLIAGATPVESLVSLVRKTARLLQPGAVLALKLEDIDDDCAVQETLSTLGLEVTSTVFDLSSEVLVAHRVSPRQRLAAA